jgi:tetratricopeptide (TPR) repeat protein
MCRKLMNSPRPRLSKTKLEKLEKEDPPPEARLSSTDRIHQWNARNLKEILFPTNTETDQILKAHQKDSQRLTEKLSDPACALADKFEDLLDEGVTMFESTYAFGNAVKVWSHAQTLCSDSGNLYGEILAWNNLTCGYRRLGLLKKAQKSALNLWECSCRYLDCEALKFHRDNAKELIKHLSKKIKSGRTTEIKQLSEESFKQPVEDLAPKAIKRGFSLSFKKASSLNHNANTVDEPKVDAATRKLSIQDGISGTGSRRSSTQDPPTSYKPNKSTPPTPRISVIADTRLESVKVESIPNSRHASVAKRFIVEAPDTNRKFGPPSILLFSQILTSYGHVAFSCGRYEDAASWYSNAINLLQTGLDMFPLPPSAAIGVDLKLSATTGKHQFNVSFFHRKLLQLTSTIYSQLALVLGQLKKFTESLACHQIAFDRLEHLNSILFPITDSQCDLIYATLRNNRAITLHDLGRLDEAFRDLATSLRYYDTGRDFFGLTCVRSNLCVCMAEIAHKCLCVYEFTKENGNVQQISDVEKTMKELLERVPSEGKLINIKSSSSVSSGDSKDDSTEEKLIMPSVADLSDELSFCVNVLDLVLRSSIGLSFHECERIARLNLG